MSIYTILLILASGLAGSWFHWRNVKGRGELGSFKDYMLINGVDGTRSTVFAFAAAMQALYFSGTLIPINWSLFLVTSQQGLLYEPFFNLISISFTAGYVCDSKLNNTLDK